MALRNPWVTGGAAQLRSTAAGGHGRPFAVAVKLQLPQIRLDHEFPRSDNPVLATQKRVKRRKEPALDKVVEANKRLRIAGRIAELLLRQEGHCMTLRELGKFRHKIGLSGGRRCVVLLRRFPGLFEVHDEGAGHLWFTFTKAAEEQYAKEGALKASLEDLAVAKVRKLLMMSHQGRVRLDSFGHIRRELGLPNDFRTVMVLRYPQYFRTVTVDDEVMLELCCWDPELAVSSLHVKEHREPSSEYSTPAAERRHANNGEYSTLEPNLDATQAPAFEASAAWAREWDEQEGQPGIMEPWGSACSDDDLLVPDLTPEGTMVQGPGEGPAPLPSPMEIRTFSLSPLSESPESENSPDDENGAYAGQGEATAARAIAEGRRKAQKAGASLAQGLRSDRTVETWDSGDHGPPPQRVRLQLPPGLKLPRKAMQHLREFHSAPLVSPYERAESQLDHNSMDAERRWVAVVHELLSLTVEKRLLVDQLTCLRRDLRLTQRVYSLLVRHPEYFYVSAKGIRHSVFLREAYQGHVLVDKDELGVALEKLRRMSHVRHRQLAQESQASRQLVEGASSVPVDELGWGSDDELDESEFLSEVEELSKGDSEEQGQEQLEVTVPSGASLNPERVSARRHYQRAAKETLVEERW